MSKELEALNKIKHASLTVEKHDATSGSITIIPIVNTEEYETIKSYLTPPTADEVCEALSECEDLDKHSFITYIPEDKSFTLFKQFRADDCYETDLVRYEQGTIYIANYYSPSIITLIGRFYDGLEEELK